MAKNIYDIIGEEEKETLGIPALLFKAQAEAHITHLLQKDKTLARHEALSMFYEGIDDLLDTFIETYMGLYTIEDICVPKACNIAEPVSYFQNLYNQIEEERKSIKENFLLNQVDEIQQLIAHTLYRLKNIIT